MTKSASIILVLLLSIQFAFAQDFMKSAKQLTIDEGLSQSTVNCIFQDSDGFMWLGTQSGLNKYDGIRFTTFTNNPLDSATLSNNWIFSISEDRQKNIWVGTRNGLNRLDPLTGKFTRFFNIPNDDHSLDDNNIFSVLADSNGNVWVKTRSVLHKYVPEEDRFYRYEHYTEYFKPSVSDINFPIIEDTQGHIWVGSKTGLDHFDPKTNTFNKFFHDPNDTTSITHDHITAIFEDSHSQIWIATENGFSLYNREHNNFEQYHFIERENQRASFNHISSITEDSEGNLWLGTQGGGIIKLKVEYQEGVPVVLAENFLLSTFFPEGHRNNVVYSLWVDRSENLWIGTDVSGLLKVDLKPKKFEIYADKSHNGLKLPSNTVSAIHERKDGSLWIGARGHGLIAYAPNEQRGKHFHANAKGRYRLLNNFVHSICEDSHDRIWLGTRNGINIFDTKTQKMKTLSEYFPHIFYATFTNVRTNVIKEDQDGNIWIGANRGLHMFNIETQEVASYFQDFLDSTAISDNLIYDIAVSPGGDVWVATFNGLNRLSRRTQKFTSYHVETNRLLLSHNTVYSLCMENDSVLWAGTANGLNRIDLTNEVSRFYNKKSGLPSTEVFKVLKDKNGNIWGSTGRGIFKVIPSDAQGRVWAFEKDDGLENLEFNTNVGTAGRNGALFFGGVAGLVKLKPEDMLENQIIPPVMFTSIFVTTQKGKKQIVPRNNELNLHHGDYDLTIEFAALDYTAPQKNNYEYRMVGLGNEWIGIGNRSFVNFSQLSPGTYHFQVHGSNNDNFWNKIGAELTIVVHPPFWRTPWAYVLYVLLSALSVYLFILYRERRLRYAKFQLQKSVTLRTAEIERQKEEILVQRDIAVQQRNQIEEQNARLEIALSQLKLAQKQLVESEKMASLGGLVAGVAHEINTPVGIGITASSSLLERTQSFAKLFSAKKVSGKELQEFLKNIYQGSKLILNNLQRTGELVKSFKQISVDESTEQLRNFMLCEYLQDVIRSLQPKYKNRPIRFHVQCDNDLEMKSYPGALAQIFTNLIINSLIHAFKEEQEEEIRIICNENGNRIELSYRDNGQGIKAEIRKRIFDPFFTTDVQSGTGLGMHIVYNLAVQKLKGKVKCVDTEGKGARFDFEFPKELVPNPKPESE